MFNILNKYPYTLKPVVFVTSLAVAVTTFYDRPAGYDYRPDEEPVYDINDRSDAYKRQMAITQATRETMIAKAMVKVQRDLVRDCYMKEGVNHYQNCRDITHKYNEMIKFAPHYQELIPPKPTFGGEEEAEEEEEEE